MGVPMFLLFLRLRSTCHKLGTFHLFSHATVSLMFCLLAVTVLLSFPGCEGISAAVHAPQSPAAEITVKISPASATLNSGEYFQFSALVTGTSQTAVTWASSAGSISSHGMLHAPQPTSAMTLKVVAISTTATRQWASAVVAVAPRVPRPSITTTTLAAGTVGTAYSETLAASGGQPPYQWSVISGALPSGIQLTASSGVISGTPSVAGKFSFVVGLKDAIGNTTNSALSLSIATASTPIQCGPPAYLCARTDTNVTGIPATLPDWGNLTGAGRIFTDPTFNANHPPTYVRVTDYNTDKNHDSFSVGAGNGDDSHFNLNDTLLWLNNGGNALFVFSLNPATLATSLVSALNVGSYCCDGQWSRVNSNYLYTITPAGVLTKLDFSKMSAGQPAATVVYNFANCGVSGPFSEDFGGIGGNDDVFVATFGAKDTPANVYVAAYSASASTCYLYRTDQGKVYSYPGGRLIGSTGPSTDTFYIHGAHLSDHTGTWLVVTESQDACPTCASLYYAWQIGTATLRHCSVNCGGHSSGTANGWLNNGGSSGHFPPLDFRPWDGFDGSMVTNENTGGTDTLNTTMDSHPTSQNDPAGTGQYPIFATTYDTAATFSAYSNEIIAWQQPGPILRFGHTFSSPTDTNFSAAYGIGAVSSTGRFYAVSTNGEGTLGSTTGNSQCALSSGNCRSDVFILKLF